MSAPYGHNQNNPAQGSSAMMFPPMPQQGLTRFASPPINQSATLPPPPSSGGSAFQPFVGSQGPPPLHVVQPQPMIPSHPYPASNFPNTKPLAAMAQGQMYPATKQVLPPQNFNSVRGKQMNGDTLNQRFVQNGPMSNSNFTPVSSGQVTTANGPMKVTPLFSAQPAAQGTVPIPNSASQPWIQQRLPGPASVPPMVGNQFLQARPPSFSVTQPVPPASVLQSVPPTFVPSMAALPKNASAGVSSSANAVHLPGPYSTAYSSSSPALTPQSSEPPSARSSRNPTPVPSQRYDFLEGQFPSNKPSPVNSSSNLQAQVSSFQPTAPISIPPAVTNNYPPVSSGVAPPTIPQTYGPNATAQHPGAQRLHYPQQVGYSQAYPPSSQPGPSAYGGHNVAHSQPSANVPDGPLGGVPGGYDPQLHAKMAGMSIHGSFSRMWGNDNINLLQDKNILPPFPIEPPKPVLPQDKPNCSPDVFRCTITKIPETQSLLQKSRLPFGILIHPFRDVNNLPVIQSASIVRCRSCRTYINPFVSFVDQRRWKCNLCYRLNELPEDFLFDPVSKSYGDPSRRPEIKNATIEFIAPTEYMLRPPQPAVYIFVLDVSYNAVMTGYLPVFCKILLEEVENLPGDSRTQIGFITFDSTIHFYNLGSGLNQPHMTIVPDAEDIFLPSPEDLLINLTEAKQLMKELLSYLPKQFSENHDTNSALGAALQAALKLASATGGRITVMQACLPNVGPGALQPREDPNQRASKEVHNLGPANDFYKKLSLDCSTQQIAVDLFLLNTQYIDIATLACVSKFSAGSVHFYPGFHVGRNKRMTEKYENDLRRYVTRKIGFEAVMRIRCTRGLSIHTFHGNFFVRSTDLLSLPNVNPDSGFGMQISIEDNLTESNCVCFQAAILYTSSKGERRIRVHTMSLPTTSLLADVMGSADQQAIVGLLAKMAVDRSISSSMSDARDALINACVDILATFKQTLPAGQTAGALMSPFSTRLLPLYASALLKHVAFRVSVSTKVDERVYAMEQMKTMPLSYLMNYIYPSLYAVHALDDTNAIREDDAVIPQPPLLQLSYEKIDRHGAYLLDTTDNLYLYVGRAISDTFCASVLGVSNFAAISESMLELPELETPESIRVRSFIMWLLSQRPFHACFHVIREDSKERQQFIRHLVDDRTESSFSYYEFLQHLKQEISK